MRAFAYKNNYKKLLTPEIVALLIQIHEQKGKQSRFSDAQKDVLDELLEIAGELLNKADAEALIMKIRKRWFS